MAGGASKINPPNSHPSTEAFHEAAMAAETGKPQQEKEESTSDQGVEKIDPVQSETPQHETNKTAVIIGVVGLVALLFTAWR